MREIGIRSVLLFSGITTLGLGQGCFSSDRSYGGNGWAEEEETTPTPPEHHDSDTGSPEEEPVDTSAEDTSVEQDTAVVDECDDETEVVLTMSPDDSNSMSSASQARAAVLGGWADLAFVTIRGWEFMNYYDFAYEPAEPGELAVDLQLAPVREGGDQQWLLQVGVSSFELSNDDRAPMNLTFVLDTSGSMEGTPLDLTREVLLACAARLREGDIISVVTWNTTHSVLLANHVHQGPLDLSLRAVAEGLEAGGSTDLYSGLQVGYTLARDSYSPDRINRVVLVSDGGANAGITSLDLIAEQAGDNDEDGIFLVGVGVGSPGTYHDTLMDQVTDEGKGASVFVDSTEEAWEMFANRFVNTMGVAARDVQLQLTLPPGFEIMRFSGEGMSSDPLEIDPQHIAPNDTMVFFNQLHTCAPDLLDSATISVSVRYKGALDFAQHEVTLEVPWADLLAGDSHLLRKGRAIDGYAQTLKKVIHQQDPGERAMVLDEALSLVAEAELVNPGDEDLAEIRAVLEALQAQPALGEVSAWGRLKRVLRERPVISAWEESRP